MNFLEFFIKIRTQDLRYPFLTVVKSVELLLIHVQIVQAKVKDFKLKSGIFSKWGVGFQIFLSLLLVHIFWHNIRISCWFGQNIVISLYIKTEIRQATVAYIVYFHKKDIFLGNGFVY